jgi:hypothetical protein
VGAEGVCDADLLDLEVVSAVCVGGIILQRFRAYEIMVGGWGSYDVAMAGDLTGESGNGAGDFDQRQE